jgi:hypothetical protein
MAYQKLQAGRAAVVTPSNTVNIPNPAAQNGSGNNGCVLYIGTGGNLRVLTVGGDDVIFTNVQEGTFLPIQVLRVFATSTTALNIIALW